MKKEHIEQVVMPIIPATLALTQGLNPLNYCNFLLEGASVPMTAYAVAGLFPASHTKAVFGTVVLKATNEAKVLTTPNEVYEYRGRILGYRVTPRIQSYQTSLISQWRDGFADTYYRYITALAFTAGLPVTFLLFCKQNEKEEQSTMIFHPGEMPTEVALIKLQGEVEQLIRNN